MIGVRYTTPDGQQEQYRVETKDYGQTLSTRIEDCQHARVEEQRWEGCE